ncbi:MAG: hypothetical protein CM15mP62_29120 [Rhodospirillaceae bacterium]|nr:MAG: hypothetical protein CM15mP62_29120 [Rhodospirillaceae bacterium]
MQALNIAATGMLLSKLMLRLSLTIYPTWGRRGLKGIELNSKTCFTKTYDGLAATRQTRNNCAFGFTIRRWH